MPVGCMPVFEDGKDGAAPRLAGDTREVAQVQHSVWCGLRPAVLCCGQRRGWGLSCLVLLAWGLHPTLVPPPGCLRPPTPLRPVINGHCPIAAAPAFSDKVTQPGNLTSFRR